MKRVTDFPQYTPYFTYDIASKHFVITECASAIDKESASMEIALSSSIGDATGKMAKMKKVVK